MKSATFLLSLTMSILLIFNQRALCQENECGFKVPQEGRNEPHYKNLVGYLIPGQFYSPSDCYKKLPQYPWKINPLEKVGPKLWDYSKRTIPAKTKVRVLEQFLKHEGWGNYSGILLVEAVEDSIQYHINVESFCPVRYWECPPHQAIRYSPFIAKVKDGVKPVDRTGRWIDIGEYIIVFCQKTSPENYVKNGIECIAYINDTKGQRIIVASEDLEIIY